MIVLDTHAWLWWNDAPHLLSPAAMRAINETRAVGVSPLSCWETSLLAAQGRITLDRDAESWIRQALAREGVMIADLHPTMAARAGQLDDRFPPDPIDRMLYATARELRAPLVTKDARLRAADPDLTLW